MSSSSSAHDRLAELLAQLDALDVLTEPVDERLRAAALGAIGEFRALDRPPDHRPQIP